jgi:hypothetical protein
MPGESINLTNQFLIAMPGMADDRFAGTVVYLCEHNDRGALGLVINKPIDITLPRLFEKVDLHLGRDDLHDSPVFFGGPVQTERGFVLHERISTDESPYHSTLAIPGAQVEAHGVWVARLSALARSLQALAWLVLALVAGVAAAMVAVATRAGIAARRATILILHDMGATDGTIARRFAGRIAWLAGLGAMLGAAAAAPLLWLMGGLAAPLLGDTLTMPWPALAALPPAAAGIAWATAHATLRLWLRSLP